VAGSALDLPFEDGSLDFVYTVGVLHHLMGTRDQEAAFGEVARVLRPGGVLIVHETNPRNPVFRLYMGYVFPVLKSIDEGVELWIEPASWRRVPGLVLERIEYFTFLPDFLPRALLRMVLPLERWLERSRLKPYSVHYMAVLRRPVEPSRPTAEAALATADATA
jgi:SAM-dependent methyltransferase